MKVCFWGNIAGALNGKTDGGGELQQALLAKALVKGGHEVVVLDFHSSEDSITPDGIRIFRIKGWNDGLRMIRMFTHRLPKLYASLKAQKADIYYCRIRDFRHIFAYWAARKVKAKFILGLASDLDAMNFSQRIKHSRFNSLWSGINGLLIELVYPWLLKKSDLVLVQHTGQKEILQRKSVNSQVLPNLFLLNEKLQKTDNSKNNFIYIGELNKRKGFAEFFNVVIKSPDHAFIIVGQPSDKVGFLYYNKLKSFANVTLCGRLSHTETMDQIANSKALISTSLMEGFPNIFIEAWAYGIPVISLYVDPGSIIEKEKLGNVCQGNIDKLIRIMNNFQFSHEFAEKAKTYVKNNHVLNANKVKEISSIFNGVLNHKD